MSLRIEPFVNGPWRQNCYFVADGMGHVLVIDPGSAPEDIAARIEANGWRPLAILNTHAHYDHVGAIVPLMARYNIPFYMHGGDARLLARANMYKVIFGSPDVIHVPKITHDIRDEAPHFAIGAFEIKWMATPGHTPGSVCFRIGDNLFTGDTLMAGGRGRTDLPGGNAKHLNNSIDKLSNLEGAFTVWGGHGHPLSLGEALAKAKHSRETAS